MKSALVRGKRRQELLRSGSPLVPVGIRGMLLDGDPGQNPLDRPRHLENVRNNGGNLDHRGKLVVVNNTPLENAAALVKDLYDFQTNAPRRLYLVYLGCPGVSAAVGFTLAWIDFDQDPVLQRGLYYAAAASTLAIGVFDGKLFLGLDAAVRVLNIIVSPYGTENLSTSGGDQAQALLTFSGFIVRTVSRTFDGKVFFGLDAGAGASKVTSWDGLTDRLDLSGINVPTAFGLWRDKLVLGFGAATNHIRVRAPGASPGTWTTVAPSAGTIASYKMVSYKDILYITDGATNVWSYDGTTLSAARTIAGATIKGLAVHDGYLYFGYQSTLARAILGRFDGTTWTDAYKDMTSNDSALRTPVQLASYRGCLVVLVQTSLALATIYVSADADTTLYSQLYPNGNPGFTSTDIRDVVVM